MIIQAMPYPAGGGGPFVGSKIVTYFSGDSLTASLTDCKDETGADATILPDDLVVFTEVQATSLSTNLSQSAQLPSDPSAVAYTPAHTDLWSSDNASTNLQVSYKFMGATPDTTVTLPAVTGTNSAVYEIHVLRGVNKTKPLDVTPTTVTSPNTSVANPPAITPITPGAIITCHGAGAWSTSGATVYTRPAELSATLNHFRAAVANNGSYRNSLCGVGIAMGWTSGAFDCSAFGGGNVSASASMASATIAWRPANGVTPLNATASPSSALGSSGTSTINSNSTTCTADGGSAPYTYAWEWVSNPGSVDINSPSSATTAFNKTGAVSGNTYTGTARCKVTDNVGTIAYSNNVNVSLERL